MYSLGVWGFQWRAEGEVRGEERVAGGGAMQGQGEDHSGESEQGWECFQHKHLRRKQTKAWNEREASCPCMENGTEEGGGLLRDLSRHIN